MTLIRRLILALALMAGLVPAFAQSPTPVPALPDTERRTSYSISASTCACAVNFALYGDSTDYANWLEVWINGVRASSTDPTVGWTITSPSGPLANLARPITDAVLTFNSVQTGTVQIVGARRPRRVSQFSENAGVSARNLNQAITDIVAMLREDWDKINDVTGRAVLAPPGETLTVLASATIRKNLGACFDSNGNLVSCVTIPSSTFSAGNGISLSGVNPTVVTNNIVANSPITITGTNPLTIACPTCSTSPTPNFAFMPTRTTAIATNLSAFSVVQTGGYAAASDGGGATFKNVGSTAFIDSFITNFTITAGSGYTNGSFFGVVLTNGSKPVATGTATVAGNIVTAVNVAGTPGASCNVGDQYTTVSLAGGTGFKITVTGCSTPLGSFTDSAGTHWQLVTGEGGFPNVRQFGAIGDWGGTDASATDNFNSIQAALWFTGLMNGISLTSGNGGFWGGRLIVPQGTFLACGAGTVSLIVPFGVTLEGASNQGSVVRMCDAFSTSTHFLTLCDSNWHTACFNSILRNIQISARNSVTGSSNAAMVYSNATQDFGGIYNVYIYAGGRGGVWFEKGYGGAGTVTIDGLSVSALSNFAQVRIGDSVGSGLNYGTTIITLHNLSLGGPSSGGTFQNGSGILLQGGFYSIENVHCESMPICIEVGIPSATGNGDLVRIHNVNAASSAPAPACSGTIVLDSTNNPGNTIIGQVPAGSCSNVIANSQTSGVSVTTPVVKDVVCTTTCS